MLWAKHLREETSMLLSKPLPFVETFISELDNGLRAYNPDMGVEPKAAILASFLLDGNPPDQQYMLGQI